MRFIIAVLGIWLFNVDHPMPVGLIGMLILYAVVFDVLGVIKR